MFICRMLQICGKVMGFIQTLQGPVFHSEISHETFALKLHVLCLRRPLHSLRTLTKSAALLFLLRVSIAMLYFSSSILHQDNNLRTFIDGRNHSSLQMFLVISILCAHFLLWPLWVHFFLRWNSLQHSVSSFFSYHHDYSFTMLLLLYWFL